MKHKLDLGQLSIDLGPVTAIHTNLRAACNSNNDIEKDGISLPPDNPVNGPVDFRLAPMLYSLPSLSLLLLSPLLWHPAEIRNFLCLFPFSSFRLSSSSFLFPTIVTVTLLLPQPFIHLQISTDQVSSS